MKIQSIANTAFMAHYINVDIGASSINGSMKVRILDEQGKTIAYSNGAVFENGSVRNENLFEKNVAENIARCIQTNKAEILKRDSDYEGYLTVCYPGPKTKEGFKLSNFYYDDKRTHKFERAISDKNIDALLANYNKDDVNIVSTRHANDMAGAASCILSKLQEEHPELLKEGEEILFLYPGGGLGSGIISVDRGHIKIKPSEMQHVRNPKNYEESLETNVGVPTLIGNYANFLQLTEEERSMIGNNAKVVTSIEEAQSNLPEYKITDLNNASKKAIDLYLSSLAQLSAMHVCIANSKNIVLTGNTLNGVREFINQNPMYQANEAFVKEGEEKFVAIYRELVYKELTGVGKKILGDPLDLKVTCIRIKDNTEGAQLLQSCEEIGEPAKWYNYICKPSEKATAALDDMKAGSALCLYKSS